MDNRIDAAKRLLGKLGIAHVAFDEGDAVGQIRGRPLVDLRLQAVDDHDVRAFVGEARDEV